MYALQVFLLLFYLNLLYLIDKLICVTISKKETVYENSKYTYVHNVRNRIRAAN